MIGMADGMDRLLEWLGKLFLHLGGSSKEFLLFLCFVIKSDLKNSNNFKK